MRYIAFLLYATLMCVFVMLAGCSNENPICTDSFCLIPRDAVDGEVTEIDESKALAFLETLAVDTPEATPVETPEATHTNTLTDIVNDVVIHRDASRFIGQEVEIEGVVKFNFFQSHDRGAITLETGIGSVIFYITDFDTPATLNDYEPDQSYTFNLFIRSVLESRTTAGLWLIYSHEVE